MFTQNTYEQTLCKQKCRLNYFLGVYTDKAGSMKLYTIFANYAHLFRFFVLYALQE